MGRERDNRAYSVRLSGADLRKLKAIATRLQVSESDLIRFSLRQTLAKLAPLDDSHTKGSSLLPVFVEFGDELTSYFDLDLDRLENILNVGADDERQVERQDIALLLIAGLENTRLYARLRELTDRCEDPDGAQEAFRDYLYEKYLYRDTA